MAGTALVMWIVTIGGGALLVAPWLARGGATRPADADLQGGTPAKSTVMTQRTRSRIGLSMIVPHASLAIVGAIVWALFSLNEDDIGYGPARWLASALLLATIAYGMVMFSRWLADRREGTDERPEQHFPVALVAFHGLGALATLLLVLLVAVD